MTGGAASESVRLTINGAARLAITGLTLAPDSIPGACNWDGYRLSCPQSARVEVDLYAGDDRLSAWVCRWR